MSDVAVAYLISEYPKVSHVFIEREIAALRQLGVRVETFTVRPWRESELLSETMRREAEATTVILDSPKQVAAHQVAGLRRSPGRYVSGLAGALRTGHNTPKARTWQGFYFAEAVTLLNHMRERGLRHVHSHFANNGADIARLVARLGTATDGPDAGWKWSFTMHGASEFDAVEHFDLAGKVREASGVACISNYTRSQMMRLVEPEYWGKLQLVPMSVDLDAYAYSDRSDRSAADPVRFLSVGRMAEAKGFPVMVEAFALLRDRGIDFTAKMIGDGHLYDQLAQQVNRLRLTDVVQLPGAMGQEELPAEYAWADAYCLSSFMEGLPVVLMEAMSTGLPVAATRIAAVGELVVDGETGYLVSPARADQLADAMYRLAKDAVRRVDMGLAGRLAVEAQHSTTTAGRLQKDFLASC